MKPQFNPVAQALQEHIDMLAAEVQALQRYADTATLTPQQKQYHAMRVQSAMQRHASALYIKLAIKQQRTVRQMQLLDQAGSVIKHGMDCPHFQAWKAQKNR